jgi:O-antigen/teichoic acid export membrane protein
MRIFVARRVVQSVFIVSVALAVEYGTQFTRSFVLTRTLGPAEFGIASSMAILAALVAMSTWLGAGRYLIQAKYGGGGEPLAVAHALTFSASAISAALLMVLAWPTSAMLGIPHDIGAFLWLAMVPLIRGFEHLRIEQVQRDHLFWPSSGSNVVANLVGLVAVTGAAYALHDHRAVLWGLCAQAAAYVCMSHMLARAPYRMSFASDGMRQALRFGLPLMLNGLALAALGQFDRLAVGGLLGVVELGRYSLATMIFYLPTSLVFRIVTAIAQPRLSAAWHDSPFSGFPRLFEQMNVGAAVGAATFATAVATLGNALVAGVFGPGFGIDDAFFAVFSLAVFMRFAKASANIGGLSIGRTKDLMLSNLPGVLGLGMTILGLLVAPSLRVAAAGLLVGETIGAGTAFLRLDRDLRASGRASYWAFAAALPIPSAAGIWVVLAHPSLSTRLGVLATFSICAIIPTWMAYQRRIARLRRAHVQ